MEKRGMSAIEFIVSFVLFAGFVAAAFYLFTPTKNLGVMDSAKGYVFGEIIKNASIDLEEYSVNITCPDNNIAVQIENSGNKNARVEDYYGNELSSGMAPDKKTVYFNRAGNGFAVIKLSDDFAKGSLTAGSSGCAIISSFLTSKVLSEKRLVDLNNSYYSSPEAARNSLNIPSNINFAFFASFLDGNKIEASRSVPLRTEVFSETKRVEVLRKSGKSEFADFTVRIW